MGIIIGVFQRSPEYRKYLGSQKPTTVLGQIQEEKLDEDSESTKTKAKSSPPEWAYMYNGTCVKEFTTKGDYVYGCDICMAKIPKDSQMYGCRQCDWDVCLDCISREGMPLKMGGAENGTIRRLTQRFFKTTIAMGRTVYDIFRCGKKWPRDSEAEGEESE